LILLFILYVVFFNTLNADINITTTNNQTTMIELFSSEGCSSCPRAEKWMNELVTNPNLWSELIPLVYHVDYWDNLGWKDRFAKYEYSYKQREYRKRGHSKGVYTPGFYINAQEWRGWFKFEMLNHDVKEASKLHLEVHNNKVSVNYKSPLKNYELHMALLGFGLRTKVPKGENKGKTLEHDFVVLEEKKVTLSKVLSHHTLLTTDVKAKRYALVVWTSDVNSMKVLQSTGGWL
jgi:hypothetical protein